MLEEVARERMEWGSGDRPLAYLPLYSSIAYIVHIGGFLFILSHGRSPDCLSESIPTITLTHGMVAELRTNRYDMAK